jgi:hypothetical protein
MHIRNVIALFTFFALFLIPALCQSDLSATAPQPNSSLTTQSFNNGILYLIVSTGATTPLSVSTVGPAPRLWNVGADTAYIIISGTGAPATISWNGTGSPQITIYKLTGRLARFWHPLETLPVPVIGTIVTSTFTTELNKVYIVSASGEGRVGFGAGGVGRPGDADYMDYNPEGVGNTDIGDRGVDYGVGIDETDPDVSPRQHKWGPWRKDHTYYTLLIGDGKPVQFRYYDSNYLDNSPTDALTVKIYAAP